MAGEFDAFNQAHDHPHVGQHWRVDHARLVEHYVLPLQFGHRGQWLAGGQGGHRCAAVVGLQVRRSCLRIVLGLWLRGRRGLGTLAASIEPLLLRLPGRRPVIRGAPLAGTLLPMLLPAAKRAPQVSPTCVAGMREKANPAVRAGNGAPAKLGMGLQDQVQRSLVLPDKRAGAIVPVPIRTKREKPLDGYGKKAKPSAILFIALYTPSSYLFDANASRGRARFFVRRGRGSTKTVRTNSPSLITHPGRSACRVVADPLRVKPSNHYLEEGSPLLLSK